MPGAEFATEAFAAFEYGDVVGAGVIVATAELARGAVENSASKIVRGAQIAREIAST